MVAEFDRSITAELDFGLEAANAQQFAKNFAEVPDARFPVPYTEFSGKRVLVMERFVGKHLDKFILEGEDTGPRVARQALRVIAKMVFEDGFFHADPHPGNIIMLGTPEAPVIGLIDLGLVGRLTDETRDKALSLVLAAATRDIPSLADSLLAIGHAKARIDHQKFRNEVAQIAERYLGRSLADIEMSALIRDLVQGAQRHEIEIPAELLMMGKALMTIEGIGKQLDPKLDIWSELQPFLTKLVMNRLSPQRVARDLFRGARQLGTAATHLPDQIHQILEDLRAGRLEVMSRDPAQARATERLGRRIFVAMIAVGALGAGTALEIAHVHPLSTILIVLAAVSVALHVLLERRREKHP